MNSSELPPMGVHTDVSSSANFNDFRITHVSLDWRVDFPSKTVAGVATYNVTQFNPNASELIFDVRDVLIDKIESAGSVLHYEAVPHPVKELGQILKIAITVPSDATENLAERQFQVSITYATTPSCSALQWLAANQTSSKTDPFVYSQCQAIHCRSLLPVQDSPSVKFTYDAKVTVDQRLTALMSAVGKGEEQVGDAKAYRFEQKVPIPAYLIALVVGALHSRQVGPRSKVWAEADVVEAAAWEFAETEKILEIAENLLGPYVWGAYDLLILPPSFPYGGMENPCLTFVTPTLLAGDRSQVSVVAHEISHSWTGNLFSCASWEHFWLNEGHTRFVEEKICATMVGNPLHRDFMALHSWNDLEYYVNLKGVDHPFTKLIPDLKGIDPDDAFSVVPYEKGMSLLAHIEQRVGGPAIMDPFIRALIEKFKYKSVDTAEWKAFLLEYFGDMVSLGQLTIDWETWLHSPGLPPKPTYDDTLVAPCHSLAIRWMVAKETELTQFSAADISDFVSVAQTAEFLSQLVARAPLPLWKIEALNKTYKLGEVKDVSRLFLWYRLALLSQYEPIIPDAIELAIVKQGRMKYTLPLFRDLHTWEVSRPLAIATFKRNRPFMHNTTASLIEKEFSLTKE